MIKMLHGVFGLPVNGIVKAMDKNSGPFEASKEQEERLIKLGLAVRVGVEEKPTDDGDGDGAPIGFDETPPEYSVDMKADELREIGKLYGLTFKVGMRKDEMVAQLDKLFAGADEETDSDDGDGDGAPTFDPTEAVQ